MHNVKITPFRIEIQLEVYSKFGRGTKSEGKLKTYLKLRHFAMRPFERRCFGWQKLHWNSRKQTIEVHHDSFLSRAALMDDQNDISRICRFLVNPL